MKKSTGAIIAFLVGLIFAVSDSVAADVRIRKHLDDMTPMEWKILADAIAALHKLDKFDHTGKPVFPQGADSYERFVQIHGDGRENGACLHGSERVWFWHRAFLLHFENRLRSTNPSASGSITLPYWDWTDLATGSHGFPAAYEDQSSPLYHDRLDHTATVSSLSPLSVARDSHREIGKEYISGLMNINSWEKFGGTKDGDDSIKGDLENNVHDNIHGSYIGKDNHNTVLAVRDPIFWAHHANLDRVVDAWQKKYPRVAHCIECDASAYDRDAVLGPLTVNDVLSNDLFKGVQVIYAPRSAALVIAAAPSATQVQSTMRSPESSGPTSAYRLKIPEQAIEAADLIIPDISVQSGTFYRTDVYLVPANVRFTPDHGFKEKYRIGVFGNFSAPDHATHASGHFSHRIAIRLDEVFRRLPSEEKGKEYQLIIQFVPIDRPASLLAEAAGSDVRYGNPQLTTKEPSGTKIVPLENLGAPQ